MVLVGRLTNQEHPRVCGENRQRECSITIWLGASPRMRGKLRCCCSRRSAAGSIPAYAGKTGSSAATRSQSAEHPRVCGENFISRGLHSIPLGASPRMRGKHLLTCGSSFLKVILHSVLFFCTGGSVESPCSSLLSECFSDRIVVYDRPGTSLLSAYGYAFWWDGG